jgi:hypothetical protein
MCRNLKLLFNFQPPVTDSEIRAASLQFVRKVSGFNKPSKANEPAFDAALKEIEGSITRLLGSLQPTRLRATVKSRLPKPGSGRQCATAVFASSPRETNVSSGLQVLQSARRASEFWNALTG